MSDFRIFETGEFRKKLEKMTPSDAEFVRRKLQASVYLRIRQSPYVGPNIRKFRGYAPETWRCRIGRFRLFYSVNENDRIVNILSVDDRKDAYK